MSKTSDGGLVLNDPYSSFTLKTSGATENTTASAEDAVNGFGAMQEIVFELAVTAVSLTGGSSIALRAWIQRKTPSGQWDDLLSFLVSGLTNGNAAVYHVGEYNRRLGLASALAEGSQSEANVPKVIQDASTTLPFAQRATWISDSLRVKHQVVTAGSPSAWAVTWAMTAKGRP